MSLDARGESLSHCFGKILERYNYARHNTEFGGQHEISQYFDAVKRKLEVCRPVADRPFLSVVASYGKGNWATIPWVSILDSRETTSTQRGTYAVYLFKEDGTGFYLKLGQGVTEAEKTLGVRAVEVLADRAKAIRAMLPDLAGKGFDLSGTSNLATRHKKARLYEASTIASKYYEAPPVSRTPMKGDNPLSEVSDVEAAAIFSGVQARSSAAGAGVG
jgi:5-methylcytosine-specific restriction enzyme B